MTINLRAAGAIVAILLLSLLIGACASSAGPALAPVGDAIERPADGGTDLNGGGGVAPEPATGGKSTNGGGSTGDGVGAAVDDARIVRTGTIDLEVKDVPTAVSAARDGIRALGGYIGASNTYSEGDRPIASITYRIPVDRWEDALDLLRGLNGQTTKVVAEQTQAVEVTGAVVDLEARIKNLRASEASLQEIATRAIKISDVLEVQDQLTQVRGQIESLEAQLKDLEDRADLATLTASYRVPVVAVEAATQAWDPKSIADDAAASLIEIGQALASAGIWFAIVWLPILVVLGILVALAAWIVRRLGVVRPRRPSDGEVAAG